MRLGFVGTGTITEAIVTGILRSALPITAIHVSPRNAAIAAKLVDASPLVHVAADNQQVVDRSDLLFLAIRPQVAEAVVRELHFRPDHHVVSLIAATDRQMLTDWIGQELRLTRAIPLPFVAEKSGVTAIFPPDPDVAAVFNALGSAIEAQSEADYQLLGVASAMMGTFYGILDVSSRWLEAQGMPYAQAQTYLAPLFASLAETAARPKAPSAEVLRAEFSTKGGLNEQVFTDFVANGGAAALTQALDGVLARIRGKEAARLFDAG
ncbi:MAG: pyrroline-5-carboxylate reductase [Rhizobium sp.]